MTPVPIGMSRISSWLYYREAAAMIDWLSTAFGFVVRIKVIGEGGRVEHSELTYGEGVIMVGREQVCGTSGLGADMVSPSAIAGANTQSLMLYVDDVDAHCAQARNVGAMIVSEPSLHDYGEEHWSDRSYGALDPEGHLWWFSQRVRTGTPVSQQ